MSDLKFVLEPVYLLRVAAPITPVQHARMSLLISFNERKVVFVSTTRLNHNQFM